MIICLKLNYFKIVKTDGLYCAPMREKAPWREHIDYHGVAAAVYCVLFGQYLDIVKVSTNPLDCTRTKYI